MSHEAQQFRSELRQPLPRAGEIIADSEAQSIHARIKLEPKAEVSGPSAGFEQANLLKCVHNELEVFG